MWFPQTNVVPTLPDVRGAGRRPSSDLRRADRGGIARVGSLESLDHILCDGRRNVEERLYPALDQSRDLC